MIDEQFTTVNELFASIAFSCEQMTDKEFQKRKKWINKRTLFMACWLTNTFMYKCQTLNKTFSIPTILLCHSHVLYQTLQVANSGLMLIIHFFGLRPITAKIINGPSVSLLFLLLFSFPPSTSPLSSHRVTLGQFVLTRTSFWGRSAAPRPFRVNLPLLRPPASHSTIAVGATKRRLCPPSWQALSWTVRRWAVSARVTRHYPALPCRMGAAPASG